MILRPFFALGYYAFARPLFKSTVPILGTGATYIRHFFCRFMFKQCGKKLFVEKGCFFGNGNEISVGNNVRFGFNFRFMQRIMNLGNDVIVEQEVLILGKAYQIPKINDSREIQLSKQKPKLSIGNHVVIGARTVITNTCSSIGNNVFIKQGAIVMQDIPDNTIVEGNPATFKEREVTT